MSAIARACREPIDVTDPCIPRNVGRILRLLDRRELETIAARLWGSEPQRFEELLLGLQADRDRLAAALHDAG